jgi:Cys-tRNA(Pro)/Cys-tRNA(Cys) deacylase
MRKYENKQSSIKIFERVSYPSFHASDITSCNKYKSEMTPGINAVKKAKAPHLIHQYTHDESSESYGVEAAEKMGVPEERVFKTLVVSLDNKELVVGVIPVSSMLSMKLIAKAAGSKKAAMADKSDVERSTGYVLGGVSPLGQKKRLRTIIDSSAKRYSTVYVSAGRRGLEIELSPDELTKLTRGALAEICQ